MTYQEFKEAVIQITKEMQITDYELYYEAGQSSSVEIYKEEVKGYSADEEMGICFRCILNGKAGYASTENLTEEEARSIVTRAYENAKSIESEEACFIHQKGDTYATCEKDTMPQPTGTQMTEKALELQKNLYQEDSRVADGTQAYMGYFTGSIALYNSNGLDLQDTYAQASCYGMPLVQANGEMYDGFKVKRGNFQDFNLKEIAKEAVEEAVSTIGAESVPSGKYTVVFAGKTMATLLQTFSTVFSAEAAQNGMSLLNGKEGQKIAADLITITDDPMHPESMIKRTFDDEGVATHTKNVVQNGALTTLLHNLKTAAKAGTKSTGNAGRQTYASVINVMPHTFYIQPVVSNEANDGIAAKKGAEALFELAIEGLYITELMGLHAGANSITGDYSLAAKGFLIADGKKAAPIKNFTVSGNFFDLLKQIEALGDDLEFPRGKYGSPSALVRNVAVAGKEA